MDLMVSQLSTMAIYKAALLVPSMPLKLFSKQIVSEVQSLMFRYVIDLEMCRQIFVVFAHQPNFTVSGMNKMVINHLEKLLVTNDAATILRELEVTS